MRPAGSETALPPKKQPPPSVSGGPPSAGSLLFIAAQKYSTRCFPRATHPLGPVFIKEAAGGPWAWDVDRPCGIDRLTVGTCGFWASALPRAVTQRRRRLLLRPRACGHGEPFRPALVRPFHACSLVFVFQRCLSPWAGRCPRLPSSLFPGQALAPPCSREPWAPGRAAIAFPFPRRRL